MIITAPDETLIYTSYNLFMGGGISNCPDWQTIGVNYLSDIPDLTLINPRRIDYQDSASVAKNQIHWENKRLKKATEILFWFPKDTLCPITLFELGKYLISDKPLFIGTEYGYKRSLDVKVQTLIERPDQIIYNDLNDLLKVVRNYYDRKR